MNSTTARKTPGQIRAERREKARQDYLRYEEGRAKKLAAGAGQVSSQEIEPQHEPEQKRRETAPSIAVTEEVFEADTVREIIGRFLGRELSGLPEVIGITAGDGEARLVLSSQETGYYRVMEDSCSCKGWYFSVKRFGIGACRHHRLAFPADAAHNEEKIRGVKLERAAEANARMRAADPNAPLVERGGFKPFVEA